MLNKDLLRIPGGQDSPKAKEVRVFVEGAVQQRFFEDGIQNAAENPKRYPIEFVREAAKLGLTGFEIPEEYGGTQMSAQEQVAAMEELARKQSGLALTVLVLNSLSAYEIAQFGTEQQKQEFLPEMARGGALSLLWPYGTKQGLRREGD